MGSKPNGDFCGEPLSVLDLGGERGSFLLACDEDLCSGWPLSVFTGHQLDHDFPDTLSLLDPSQRHCVLHDVLERLAVHGHNLFSVGWYWVPLSNLLSFLL